MYTGLPLELTELDTQLDGVPCFTSYLNLAKRYLSSNNLFNTISLLEKALQLASSQPKGSVKVKDVVSCSVVVLTLPSQPGFRQEFFDKVQALLSEAAVFIRAQVPFHPLLPSLKGFWYLFNDKLVHAQYYFRKALKRTPVNAFATIGMALSHFKLGNYDQALDCFLRCTLFSNNGQKMPVIILDYRLGIALCHLELQRDQVALNILNNILKQSPGCLEASLLISMLQLRQLQTMGKEPVSSLLEEKALTLLKTMDTLFVSHQNHPGLALLLSEVHFLARNYDQAYSFVQTALSHKHQTSVFRLESYFLTGRILYAEGEFTEARRFLSQVQLLNKDHTPAAILLSLLDFQEGELDEALNRLSPIVSLNSYSKQLLKFNTDLSLKALFVTIQAQLSLSLSDSNSPFDVTEMNNFTVLFKNCSTHQEDLVVAALLEFTSACERRHEWGQAGSNLTNLLELFKERHCSDECLIRLAKCANNAAVAFMLNENKLETVNRLLSSGLDYAKRISGDSPQLVTVPLKYNTALVHEKFGRIDEAKEIYETLNQEAPGYFNAKLKLGAVAQHRKDSKLALQFYKTVVDSAKVKNLKELVIKALLLQGVLYHNHNSLTQARHSFKRVLADLDSDNLVALIYVGFNYLILARQQPESAQRKEYYRDAAQYFRRVHLTHPNNPYPVAGIGCILSDQHDFDTAAKIFKEIGGRVEYPINIANLGHCLFRLGNFEEAAAMYGNAVNSCTINKPSLMQCHARALYALGIQKKCRLSILKSIEELRKAILLSPSEQSLKFNLGLALQFFGQLVCDREALDITEYRVERAIHSVEESKQIFQDLQIFAMTNKTIYPPPLVDSRLGFCTTLLSKLELRLAEERKKAALEKPFQVEKFETYQPQLVAPGARQTVNTPKAEDLNKKDEPIQDVPLDEKTFPVKPHSENSPVPGSPEVQPSFRRQTKSIGSSSNSSPLTDYEEYDPAESRSATLNNDVSDPLLVNSGSGQLESKVLGENITNSKRKLAEIIDKEMLEVPAKKVNHSVAAPEYNPSAPAIEDAEYNPETRLEYDPEA